MKKAYLCSLIFFVIVAIIFIHIYKISTLINEIEALSDLTVLEYNKNNWEEVCEDLKKIEDLWKKNRLWICSTISTKQIDEIEISLKQSIEYAKVGSGVDFIGEFSMFRLCIGHIPMQEGLSLYELL